MEATRTRREDKIKAWLAEPYDLLFICLMIFAIALRLYYFNLTKGQPLWWDEAEYMLKAKSMVFGTPETGWYRGQPVFLPFLAAVLFKIGLGEVTVRLLWVLLSSASLFLIYRTSATLFNKRVGLYAVALGSVSYLDLFYTSRLLVDMSQVFFVVLSASLFVSYFYGRGTRGALWAVLPVLFLGIAMRFTVGIFSVVLALFLLVIKGTTFVKEKDWHISLALGLLTFFPFMLYFWKTYGNPVLPIVSSGVLRTLTTMPSRAAKTPGQVLAEYVRFFPNFTTPIVTAVFLAGVVIAIVSIASRMRPLRQDPTAQRYLLLLLWIVIPFLFFALVVDHFDDRFLTMIFPAVFILTGVALDTAYSYLRKYNFVAATAVVATVIVYSGYVMAVRSDSIIKAKLQSFNGIRDAGLWLKARTQPGDAIISSSVPQNTYYSERATFGYPKTERRFEELLRDKKPKYIVLSLWEQSPEWAYLWPDINLDKVSVGSVFFLDKTRTKPMVVVYALK
jgi:4-amino-4-deoxy-L-arabinose transferase-like glycosyltransferase